MLASLVWISSAVLFFRKFSMPMRLMFLVRLPSLSVWNKVVQLAHSSHVCSKVISIRSKQTIAIGPNSTFIASSSHAPHSLR